MQYNMPSYDTTKYTFGPARLWLGVVGTTPTVELGAVTRNTTITITREMVDVMQGNPEQITKTFCVAERVDVAFEGLEINVLNLPYALGAGVTSSDGTIHSISFGGDMNVSEAALKLQHIHPSGATEDFYAWKVRGSGNLARDFSKTPTHDQPMTLSCLYTTTDWAGSSLANNSKYFKWEITDYPT